MAQPTHNPFWAATQNAAKAEKGRKAVKVSVPVKQPTPKKPKE
jgi:hypothetical protein